MSDELMPEDSFVENILGVLPKEVITKVEVPSRGKFYTKDNSELLVEIRPMTWDDEKAISLSKRGGLDPLNYIMDKCVTNVAYEDLLLLDKMSLIIKVREISYGEEYKAVAVCRKCDTDNNLVFNLSKLPIIKIPEDMTDPREIDLPEIQKKAKVRFPRVEDEIYLDSPKNAIEQLWRFVPELAGSTDKVQINKLLSDERFPLKAVHRLVNASTGKGYGIQTEAKFICDKCQFHNTMRIPLDQDFFSVS